MEQRESLNKWLWLALALAGTAMAVFVAGVARAKSSSGTTASPIKRVIVLIGENRSFDQQSEFNHLPPSCVASCAAPDCSFR